MQKMQFKISTLVKFIMLPNKGRQTSMPLAGFESTIPVFKRAKTFHALERAATVTGS
jgi:hypothetical protein